MHHNSDNWLGRGFAITDQNAKKAALAQDWQEMLVQSSAGGSEISTRLQRPPSPQNVVLR
jgi:hypothetical protein